LSFLLQRLLKQTPCGEWSRKTVGEIVIHAARGEDAVKAIANMNQSGAIRLIVTENGGLVGVLALRDMLTYFSLGWY